MPKPSESKRKLYERYQFRVNHARKVRETWEKKYKVEELEKFYAGFQKPESDEITVVLNHFQATAKSMFPNLVFAMPKFTVRPRPGRQSPVEESHAAIGEGLLQAIGEQDFNFERSSRLALMQSFFRAGFLKIAYDPELVPNPNAGEPLYETNETGDPILDPATIRPTMGPDGMPARDPQTGAVVPDTSQAKPLIMRDPKTGQGMTEPDEITTDEAYRYYWADARRMLLPDEGPDDSQWTWIGEEIVVPLEDAKEDQRFPKRLRNQLRANEKTEKYSQTERDYFAPEEEVEHLCYYEIYDIKRRRLVIFADGQQFDEFLYEDDLPDGVEDHPYALLRFEPNIFIEPGPWPIPLTFSWLEPQREYNIRRTQIIQGAKRSARKVYFDDNTFPDVDEATKAMQSSADMEAVKLNDTTRPPIAIPDPQLPATIFQDVPLLQADWRIITGQSGARIGKAEGHTATEASFVERASGLRDVDMRQTVQTWLSVAGKKMLQRVKATLTLDMWIKMRGFSDSEFQKWIAEIYKIPMGAVGFMPGLKEMFREQFGQERWQRVTREMLEFEAEVDVVPGSQRPRNLEVERMQWLNFLQIIGRNPQLALSRGLLKETAAKFDHPIPDRIIDEINALAQQMVMVNANQAGRNQGGADGAGSDPRNTPQAGMPMAGLIEGAARAN